MKMPLLVRMKVNEVQLLSQSFCLNKFFSLLLIYETQSKVDTVSTIWQTVTMLSFLSLSIMQQLGS